MTVVNIRGTSGSGKSTLVHRFLEEHPHEDIFDTFTTWKKPKIVAYKCFGEYSSAESAEGSHYFKTLSRPTFIVGRYETQCGGCDTLSYKGSHDDIEALVRGFLAEGNVIFEGLTISSTLTRWRRISEENPEQFVWAFMMTDEETCHQRILGRSGREPKRDAKGLADYQRKYRGCMNHLAQLKADGQRTLELTSDNDGYRQLLEVLK